MALKSGAPLMSSGANLVRYAARFGMRTMLYAGEKLGLNRPPRAPNEFATHIPILIGIARILPIRHVLELGCGTYSTLTFLNRTALPDLIGLDSLETDLAWAERLRRRRPTTRGSAFKWCRTQSRAHCRISA
jgi:hypothetical protein